MSRSDLVPEYRVPGSAVRKAYKMVAALAPVPVGKTDMAWRYLKPTLPSDMAQFTSYFKNTWIGNSASDPGEMPKNLNIVAGFL